MDGRLLPHRGATAVSARYYGAVTSENPDRLAGLAGAEREGFAQRWPRYRDRFLAATLAQGAALHMLTGSTGVKDLDVVLFFAAIPGERFAEFPRLVKHLDFSPSSLGRQAYDLAAARDDRRRRQRARWADQYRGRRVDPVKRALPAPPGAGPLEVIRSWQRAGLVAPEIANVLSGGQAGCASRAASPPAGHLPGAGSMSRAERHRGLTAGLPSSP